MDWTDLLPYFATRAGLRKVQGVAEGAAAQALDLSRSTPRKFVIAGNRFQLPRTSSITANQGKQSRAVRIHRSPPYPVSELRAVWYAGYYEANAGWRGLGNDMTVTAAIMDPIASSPGPYKAFRKNGATTITVPDGSLLISDPLSHLLPANTEFRLRNWASAPSSEDGGRLPYGMPRMGKTGGQISGFTTTNDQGDLAETVADITQTSANASGFNPAAMDDQLYEPIILAKAYGYHRVWCLGPGDSLTQAPESGTAAPIANAGDAYGNKGWWERTIALLGDQYLNIAISGSHPNIWDTSGRASIPLELAGLCCNCAVVALGTNTNGQTASQILTSLQNLVYKVRAFADIVIVPTIPPRTTGTFTSAGGQTPTSDTSTYNAINTALRAGQISGATVIDIRAIVQDPANNDVWRSDNGALTDDGTHDNPVGAAFTAPYMAAEIRSKVGGYS